MLRTCSPPYPSCCCPVPSQFDFHRPLRKRRKPISICFSNNRSHSTYISALAFTPPITVTELHEKNYSKDDNCSPDPDPSLFRRFYYIFYSNDATNENPESQDQEQEQEEEQKGRKTKKAKGLFTNMWWANLRAALGQRFNLEGIASSAMVVLKDQHLALPHVSVPDIRSVDWVELHRRGFKGVVFDKDNTITAPYSLKIWGPLCSSLQQCKTIFGPNIAVFSNSAGLCEYDVDGSKARALEGAVGIRVIRHGVKKPAGTAEEIEKHFGCKSSQLIMVGDRPFTDIVFGNRNGFLTILTEPLSLAEEPFIVTQVRKLERFLVDRWFRKDLKPTSHRLLSDESFCIKDPSTS